MGVELQYVWVALAGGAAAFAHCLGMCGGFALHLSAYGASGGRGGERPSSRPRGAGLGLAILRHALWHAGRITTYMFLGALAGWLGAGIVGAATWTWASDALAWVTGAIMVLIGLKMLGLWPRSRGVRSSAARPADSPSSGILATILGPLLTKPSASGALALGIANGFLPCPVVVFFLAFCVQSHSPVTGMTTMAAMGLGTVWSLALLGAAGGALRPLAKKWGARIAGFVLILLGVVTTLRASDTFHVILGCPGHCASGRGGAASGNGTPSCCGSHAGAGESGEQPPCCHLPAASQPLCHASTCPASHSTSCPASGPAACHDPGHATGPAASPAP